MRYILPVISNAVAIWGYFCFYFSCCVLFCRVVNRRTAWCLNLEKTLFCDIQWFINFAIRVRLWITWIIKSLVEGTILSSSTCVVFVYLDKFLDRFFVKRLPLFVCCVFFITMRSIFCSYFSWKKNMLRALKNGFIFINMWCSIKRMDLTITALFECLYWCS